MNEGRGEEIARVGRITNAVAKASQITLSFEPLGNRFTLRNNDLWKLSRPLDIADFEFSRNHVAIKDRDMPSVLSDSGFEFANALRCRFLRRREPNSFAPEMSLATGGIRRLTTCSLR
jgi:hypothetical protein